MNALKLQTLTNLLEQTKDDPHVSSPEDVASFLLKNGVSVDIPEPSSWPVPGSVAIATVRGEGPMVVTRIKPVVRPVVDDAVWVTAEPVHRRTYHPEYEVTVTSRAAVVTEADRAWFEGFLSTEQQHAVFREWWNEKLEGGSL